MTAYPPASTGLADLDALIGGGLPRGEISEITGEASSGGTSVILSLLAEATARGEVAAYIDVSDSLDPISAVAAGVELERLLWVRCGQAGGVQFPASLRARQAPSKKKSGTVHFAPSELSIQKDLFVRRSVQSPFFHSPSYGGRRNGSKAQRSNHTPSPNYSPPPNQGETAWRALNLVVSAGGFGVIVLDLGGVSGRRLGPWRNRPWMRLMRTVKDGSTVLVILTPRRLTSGLSSLAVELNRHKAHWTGRQGISLLFNGVETQVRVVSQRVRREKTA